MRVCFYCGSDEHKALDCPSRAIVAVSNLPKALMQAQKEQEYLDNLSGKTLKEILNTKFSDPALETIRNIAALQGLLFIGFVEIERLSKELEKIYHLLSAYLPHPVRTEAQDLYKIGVTMLRRGFHEEAERKLLEAKDKDPSSFAIYVALGQVCVETERDEEALRYFELAERNADEPKQRAFAFLLQGRCLMTMKRYDYMEAQYRLAQGVKLTPQTGLMWYALAQGAGVAGNSEKCIDALQEAIRLDARNYVRALLDPFMDPVSTEIQGFCTQLSQETYNLAVKEVERVENELKELKKLRAITISHKNRTKEFQYAYVWFLPVSCSTLGQALSFIKSFLSPTRYLPSRIFLELNIYSEVENIKSTIQRLLQEHTKHSNNLLEEGISYFEKFLAFSFILAWPVLISIKEQSLSGVIFWLLILLMVSGYQYAAYRDAMHRLDNYWLQKFITQKYRKEDKDIADRLSPKIHNMMGLLAAASSKPSSAQPWGFEA